MIHEIQENGRETAPIFPKVKALIPIREAGEFVYVSGHGPEDINTYEPLYRGRVGADLTMEEGRQAAAEFMDKLKLCSIETHVADSRTAVLHPASHTHRQLNEEQLKAAGVDPSMIRFSLGLEDVEDIIEDVRQALEN